MLERLRTSSPLMEVYIQNVASDEARGRAPPTTTTSSANFSSLMGRSSVRSDKGTAARDDSPHPLEAAQPGRCLRCDGGAGLAGARAKSIRIRLYVRREFLGESRCFVFDVRPLRDGKEGFFVGWIWIEDRDYNLVRFNGASGGSEQMMSGVLKRRLSFHMDGWRVNAAPGVWVPSYVYSEETDLNYRVVLQVVL